jgi:uncharacterized damage-inducible protein DinB
MIERYRNWYEHEQYGNERMLTMIESVPEERRDDPKFARALELAAHLAACRENFVERLMGTGVADVEWWPKDVALESLRPRFAKVEARWSAYLAGLSDSGLFEDFIIWEGADGFRFGVEGQIFQLVGHAYYHRGQIAQLVDMLGGTTVDTDYADWEYERNPRFGEVEKG